MSQFSDDLRATLAKKQASLLARQMVEERQLDEARRRADETRRAATRLSREVFLPLLQEFLAVMEQAGVLCGGVIEQGAGSGGQGVSSDSVLPAPSSMLCLRAQGGGVIEQGAGSGGQGVNSDSVLPAPSSMLCLRAQGTAPGSPHYEIRAECMPTEDGRIDVAVHCLDRTAAEFGAVEPEKPLVEFAPKTFKAPIHHDAAGQWCAGLLRKCAEVIMEANGKKT